MCEFRGETVCSLIEKYMGEILMLKRANDLRVSVVKWLATRNPKLSSWVRIRLGLLFCDTFFFNSALFSFFVYLSLSLFPFCSFEIFSAIFFLHFYSFQVYFKFSMHKIRHESQLSSSLAVSVFESSTSLSTFPSLAVSV